VDASTDSGSDAAQALDASEDTHDGSDDAGPDALEDAGADGAVDASSDADAGDPDDGGGDGSADGDAPDDDAGDLDDAGDDDAGDAGCEPLTWYQDLDGDGWGVDSETIEACEPPGTLWSLQSGDCDDANDKVYPGQTEYFTQGYVHSVTSEISFDYDCDGKEENQNEPTSSQAECHAQSIGKCTGTGYLPVNPARPGASVNQFCGSTTLRTCTPILNLLGCEPPKINSSAEPLGCR